MVSADTTQEDSDPKYTFPAAAWPNTSKTLSALRFNSLTFFSIYSCFKFNYYPLK